MPDEQKRRPALVISPDRRNDRAHTVVVIPCSTVSRLGPWHVELRRGEGGLPEPSVAKCENITTLEKSLLILAPLGARLSLERLQQIRECLLRALDFDDLILGP
jgi:mRNA-degrading endonuclease toxin of MazEF toxin-antitoxin module